jgi:hypothetical protein
VASTGIENIDTLLNGGLPVGAISELTGPESSGRTSLAFSFLAQRTAEDRVCAWVDVHDVFDPASAAANGVALTQLLWVRCNEKQQQRNAHAQKHFRNGIWTRLDQALRTTDLLLQAGGFAAIVLDLGSTAPERASRIPLATWFRFRQAADRTRTSLLVLVQTGCAQSSAAVVLECASMQPLTAGGTILRGFDMNVLRERERFAPAKIRARITGAVKKPPASSWTADAQWQREKRL